MNHELLFFKPVLLAKVYISYKNTKNNTIKNNKFSKIIYMSNPIDEIINRSIFDPLNITGVHTKASVKKAAKEREKLEKEYRDLWWELKKKDVPLELLDIPKPEAELQVAGGGGGFPGLTIPILNAPSGGPSNIRRGIEAIRRGLERMRRIRHDLLIPEEERYNINFEERKNTVLDDLDKELEEIRRENNERPVNTVFDPHRDEKINEIIARQEEDLRRHPHRDEGKHDRSFDTDTDEEETKEERKERELEEERKFTPGTVSSGEIKLEDIVEIGVTPVTRMLERLMAAKRGVLTIDEKRQEKIKNALLEKNKDLAKRILRAFNMNGIYLKDEKKKGKGKKGKSQKDITKYADEIAEKLSARQQAELRNDIFREFQNEALERKDTTTAKLFSQRIDTQNLGGESPPRNITPAISEIPNINESIASILRRYGVSRIMSNQFVNQLISRLQNFSAEEIGRRGSIDAGRLSARDVLEGYLETIENELSSQFSKLNINWHNVGKDILSVIFFTKEAFNKVTNMKFKDKVNVFRRLKAELTTELAVEEEKAPRQASDRQMLEGIIADRVNQIQRDGEGNVIIDDPQTTARILRFWSNSRSIIQRGKFNIKHSRGDPDDPEDPSGGNFWIIEFPNADYSIRVSKRNFIMALVILGTTSTTITGIVKAVEKEFSEGGSKSKTIKIEKDKDGKMIVKPIEGGYEKLPVTDRVKRIGLENDYNIYNKVVDKHKQALRENDINEIDQTEGQLKRLLESISKKQNLYPDRTLPTKNLKPIELNDRYLRLGLKDDIVNYNKTVKEIKDSIRTNPKAIPTLKQKLDKQYKVIQDVIELQPRGDDAIEIPQKVKLDIPIHNRVKLGDKATKIDITDEISESGYAYAARIYNAKVDEYNAAVDKYKNKLRKAPDGSIIDKGELQRLDSELRSLEKGFSQNQLSPSSDVNLPTEETFIQAQISHENDLQNLKKAINEGASQREIDILKRKFLLSGDSLRNIAQRTKALSHPKTYLTNIQLEQLPKNEEETVLFNKLQRMEKLLHTVVNPNDKENRAKKEYNDFVNTSLVWEALLSDKDRLDNIDYYNRRIENLNDLFQKYKMPESAIEQIEKDPIDDIKDDEEKDDDFTNININPPDTIAENKAEDFERPSQPIGGEAFKLATTDEEKIKEEKLWAEYSFVKRGHGLGAKNPLYLENLREEKTRYGPLRQPPKSHKEPTMPPRKPQNDPKFIPQYQMDDIFEDAYDNSVFNFTPERANSVNWNAYENNSRQMPESALHRYKPKPTRILQIRDDGQRFVQYSYNYAEPDLSYNGSSIRSGVVSDHVNYDNQWGFPKNKSIDPYYYMIAKKKH